jgi:1-acyl-sn-glycerol-3-phosphate acyltransferase
MNAVRSLVYDVLQTVVTVGFLLLFMFLLILPAPFIRRAVHRWAQTIRFLSAHVLGMEIRVVGVGNIPEGAVLIASKHQSAWETAVYFTLFPGSVYVLKKELLSLPVWGWYARKYGAVAVDRSGGAAALKKLLADAKAYLDSGRSVVIFPEGTRIPPGQHREFHPGVAAIYKSADVPTVPVALNSGLFWGRRSIGMKRPGVITLEFLAPIYPGLTRKAFMDEVQTRINTVTGRLEAEALAEFPHLRMPPGVAERESS